MSGPFANHITLDRTNLRRLAEVLRGALPITEQEAIDADDPLKFGMIGGWNAACEALERLADAMPDLYGDDGYPLDLAKDATAADAFEAMDPER